MSSSTKSSSTKKSKNWKFFFKYADQVWSMTVPDKYDEKKIYEKMLNDEYKLSGNAHAKGGGDTQVKGSVIGSSKFYVNVFTLNVNIPVFREMFLKGRWTKIGKLSDIVRAQQSYSDLFFKFGCRLHGPIRDIIPYTWGAGPSTGFYFTFKHNYPLGLGNNPLYSNSILSFGKKSDADKKKVYLHNAKVLNGKYEYFYTYAHDPDLFVMPF